MITAREERRMPPPLLSSLLRAGSPRRYVLPDSVTCTHTDGQVSDRNSRLLVSKPLVAKKRIAATYHMSFEAAFGWYNTRGHQFAIAKPCLPVHVAAQTTVRSPLPQLKNWRPAQVQLVRCQP